MTFHITARGHAGAQGPALAVALATLALLAVPAALAQGSRAAAGGSRPAAAAPSPMATPSSVAAAAAAASAAAEAGAVDRAEVERTTIVGNRELPKVLYIVPWKRPTAPPLAGRMPGSVLDEALQPIDRDVLRRRLQFQRQLGAAQAFPQADPNPSPGAKP